MRESLQKKEDEFKVRAPTLPPLTLSVEYTDNDVRETLHRLTDAAVLT